MVFAGSYIPLTLFFWHSTGDFFLGGRVPCLTVCRSIWISHRFHASSLNDSLAALKEAVVPRICHRMIPSASREFYQVTNLAQLIFFTTMTRSLSCGLNIVSKFRWCIYVCLSHWLYRKPKQRALTQHLCFRCQKLSNMNPTQSD